MNKINIINASDCDWSYTTSRGKGGQKTNKTASAVHCSHRESGAHGYAEDSRSQADNKKTAFRRMIETDKFKAWMKIKLSKITGQEKSIEDEVERQMKNIKVEIKHEGKWVNE